MSSVAVVESVVEKTKAIPFIVAKEPEAARHEDFVDQHPFLVVFVAMIISLMAAAGMVGTILAWLALRHSGIMAP